MEQGYIYFIYNDIIESITDFKAKVGMGNTWKSFVSEYGHRYKVIILYTTTPGEILSDIRTWGWESKVLKYGIDDVSVCVATEQKMSDAIKLYIDTIDTITQRISLYGEIHTYSSRIGDVTLTLRNNVAYMDEFNKQCIITHITNNYVSWYDSLIYNVSLCIRDVWTACFPYGYYIDGKRLIFFREDYTRCLRYKKFNIADILYMDIEYHAIGGNPNYPKAKGYNKLYCANHPERREVETRKVKDKSMNYIIHHTYDNIYMCEVPYNHGTLDKYRHRLCILKEEGYISDDTEYNTLNEIIKGVKDFYILDTSNLSIVILSTFIDIVRKTYPQLMRTHDKLIGQYRTFRKLK